MTPAAAIVLAAGEGRRMGGPKALLVVDGKPLIWAHVQRLREVSCWPILVMTRTAAAAELRGVLGEIPSVHIVCADTHSMAATLTVAVHSLAPRTDRVVLVAPVDTLPAQRSTLDLLLTAAMDEGTLVATPQYQEQSGHPIAMREQLLQAFRQGYAGTLRDLVRSAGGRRRRIAVDDAAVQLDLNTPADLTALRPGLVPRFAARALSRRDAGALIGASR